MRFCQYLRQSIAVANSLSPSWRPALLLRRDAQPAGNGRTHPYARKRQLLPVVLSADEIARFLAAVPKLKHRMARTTAYAAGLRVSEVVRLIVDIDSSRMLIRIDQGKGGKDRYVMLSTQLLAMLRSKTGRQHGPVTGSFPPCRRSEPSHPQCRPNLPQLGQKRI